MESSPKKISAFALAKESFSICAEIGVDEILQMRPDWSSDQAVAFLCQHGDSIGREMAIHGAVMLAAMLAGGRNGN